MACIIELLKTSVCGTLLFLLGFLIGTILDIMFFKLYTKLDPLEENLWIMAAVGAFQIFTMMIYLTLSSQLIKNDDISTGFKIGMITSFLFTVDYAATRFNNYLYNRKTKESMIPWLNIFMSK